MRKLPDSTKLEEMYKNVKGRGYRSYGKWGEYLQGFELGVRSGVSAAVLRLIWEGYPDIGSVRKADIENLLEVRGIGLKKAVFIKEMFKAKESVSGTEEIQPAKQSGHEPQENALHDLPFIHNPMRKSSGWELHLTQHIDS